tara:strand:- start:164 stop:1009 length:846 start_codon:yes stop_codon:yes gene_type:complete
MRNKILYATLIGYTNSGKSTILNSIVGKNVSITNKKKNTTIDSVVGVLNLENIQLIINDTPGLGFKKNKLLNSKNLNSNLWNAINITSNIFYVIDASKKNIIIEENIINQLKKDNKKIIIILNKIDLIKKSKLIPIIDNISKKYNLKDIFPISAKFNLGLDEFLLKIKKYAILKKWIYDKEINTDKDNLFISNEITRNSLLINLNQEIPYSLKVITKKWKNIGKNRIIIHQNILISKNKYKKIILGKSGLMIKKIRIHSQKELFNFFNKKINLFLRVILDK